MVDLVVSLPGFLIIGEGDPHSVMICIYNESRLTTKLPEKLERFSWCILGVGPGIRHSFLQEYFRGLIRRVCVILGKTKSTGGLVSLSGALVKVWVLPIFQIAPYRLSVDLERPKPNQGIKAKDEGRKEKVNHL